MSKIKFIGPLKHKQLEKYGGVDFLCRKLTLRVRSEMKNCRYSPDKYIYFLCTINENVVAWLTFNKKDRPMLYVKNEHRRKGIGTKLVQLFRKKTRSKICGIGWNKSSKRFWKTVDGVCYDNFRCELEFNKGKWE